MSRVRTAVLISGRGSNMLNLLAAAEAADYPADIRLVLSNDPAAAGLAAAAERGVETLAIDHRPFGKDRTAHERLLLEALERRGVELVALAGYMRILTRAFTDALKGRLINIHPSLLPLYPGLDTHARALAAGDAEAGCTVHWVTEVVDEGPILGQSRVPILPGDDPDALAARVLAAEHVLYPACLADAARQIRARSAS